jgi:hypothetical protein
MMTVRAAVSDQPTFAWSSAVGVGRVSSERIDAAGIIDAFLAIALVGLCRSTRYACTILRRCWSGPVRRGVAETKFQRWCLNLVQ